MKDWIINKLGGYTQDEYVVRGFYAYIAHFDYNRDEAYSNCMKNFFLDTIQGKNRDEHGKFTSRDSLKEYFAWCKMYGQMPHKKLTNAFMRYERSLSKVKSVKLTGEAKKKLLGSLTVGQWAELPISIKKQLGEA